MWFHSLLASRKLESSRSLRPTRLVLEHLEDRTLPSNYSAASVSALVANINAANKAGGVNTITLTAPTASPYALTAANNTTNGANGLPVIAAKDELTIFGNGDTIERSTAPGTKAFRLFDVAAAASLTLQDLTLQDGLATGAGVSAEGGAVNNQGNLTLSGVTVQGNRTEGLVGSAAAGGAIWSKGSLTLENGTLLQYNSARGGTGVYSMGGAAFGGAVYVAGGTANITYTTFTTNETVGGTGSFGGGNAFGGALYVAAGQVVVTTTTLNGNGTNSLANPSACSGGGLYVAGGTVTLASDTVESNEAYDLNAAGGGVFIAEEATVYIDAFTLANVINNTAAIEPNIEGTYIKT